MTRAGIVADDLTGAADSAVQFARAGWDARLALGDEAVPEARPDPDAAGPVTGADVPDAGGPVTGAAGAGAGVPAAGRSAVLAVVTDSRALDASAAHDVTAAAVRDLVRRGVDRVLVKIDSTMRGSVAHQVSGALEAWRERHPQAFAVVSPAYPALGRTVEDGRLLVDGAGVETTSVGRDPVTPVTTSLLSDLLPGSAHVVVASGDARDLALRLVEASAAGADVVTVEAATDADLVTTADAVRLLGARAVPVGSAGLAVAVSRAWAPEHEPAEGAAAPVPAHLVVVLSSLHDASRSQYEHLVRTAGEDAAPGQPGVRTVAPTLAEVLAGDLAPALGRAEPTAADARDDRVVVVLAPPRAAPDGTAAPEATAASGPTDAERVAEALAVLTERVVADLDDVGLVLVGGEGARAVLRRLGATAVRVRGAVREGVPHGTLEGGRLHGTPVVTKAGGFGPVTTLADVVPVLLGRSDASGATGAPAPPATATTAPATMPAHATTAPTTTARGDRP